MSSPGQDGPPGATHTPGVSSGFPSSSLSPSGSHRPPLLSGLGTCLLQGEKPGPLHICLRTWMTNIQASHPLCRAWGLVKFPSDPEVAVLIRASVMGLMSHSWLMGGGGTCMPRRDQMSALIHACVTWLLSCHKHATNTLCVQSLHKLTRAPLTPSSDNDSIGSIPVWALACSSVGGIYPEDVNPGEICKHSSSLTPLLLALQQAPGI